MYYPYLRGKQFELKALREFSEEHKNVDFIVPIVEPVNSNYGALNLAIHDLINNHYRFALIINPQNGDFSHSTMSFNFVDNNEDLQNNPASWIPSYQYCGNSQSLHSLIMDSPYEQIMLVFKDAVDFIDDEVLRDLVSLDRISHIVFNNDSNMSRRSKRYLLGLGKAVIGLNDCFNEKQRNADYLNNDDEPFSEMPFYFTDDGLWGFSDYTALSSKYVEGGMMPYALAIHLTYQRGDDQIYIHHFVSDTNQTRSDIRGKFMEAARKIPRFYMDNHLKITNAVEDIIQRVSDGDGYPGLGYLKKLSVLNHLELIFRIISPHANK